MLKRKKIFAICAATFILAPVAVYASDAPTDEGQYIWQDENGDFWYRNGTEDEYIGEGNYGQDPDSGEWMEANNAGWTEEEGYFEPHYHYDGKGGVWFEQGDDDYYIGSTDQYYIDDNGQLCEISGKASGDHGADTASETSAGDSEDQEAEKTGELYMLADFKLQDTIMESMPDGKLGYSEIRSVNENKSMAVLLKVKNEPENTFSTPEDFMAEYYPGNGSIAYEEAMTIASYPAMRYQYKGSINDEDREIDALVCLTDDYSFGLFILTEPKDYDDNIKKANVELIKTADLIYAERIDMASTEFFQVLTPERWKYLCHYQTEETENDGYKLIYYCEEVPVLTLEVRAYDGTDQPLDSVWQGYLGRIQALDGKQYDLTATISQYSEDASDDWKEMYNTYEETINGIRIMDGCVLREGSHL